MQRGGGGFHTIPACKHEHFLTKNGQTNRLTNMQFDTNDGIETFVFLPVVHVQHIIQYSHFLSYGNVNTCFYGFSGYIENVK